MNILIIILGIIIGALIAFGLDKRYAEKIEKKNYKIIMKITAYFIFVLFGFLFASISNLMHALSKFIDKRIEIIEGSLNNNFPDLRIMEIEINTDEFTEVSNQLQQSLNNIDKHSDSFFEELIYNTFISKLTPAINAVDTGANTLAMGSITLKSLLINIKEMSLNAISPYFIILNILIVLISIISIGIYIGIAKFFIKGGGTYNKSLVFGNYEHDEFNRSIEKKNKFS